MTEHGRLRPLPVMAHAYPMAVRGERKWRIVFARACSPSVFSVLLLQVEAAAATDRFEWVLTGRADGSVEIVDFYESINGKALNSPETPVAEVKLAASFPPIFP